MSSHLKINIPFATQAEVIELVNLFESCELPYERWTHRAHIAVAAIYLRRFSLEEATDRARRFIPQYNLTRGDPNGYHETITILFMRLVEREMRVAPTAELASFVNDLAGRFQLGWLLRYYSSDLLWSDKARAGFVMPDLRPLDF